MSDEEEPFRFGSIRAAVLGVGLLVIVLAAAAVARLLSSTDQPLRHHDSPSSQSRPIIQIVRQQPGLPDLADLVDRLCPSVAIVVPHGSDPTAAGRDPPARASAYSADGWLVTAFSGLPAMPLDAIFGDGRRANVTDLRVDAVSGLAIVKVDEAAAPLTFSDQASPRVGQFGLGLATPGGTGCSASASMIGSDFVTDGSGGVGYVRLQPSPDDWAPGTPLIGGDGRVVGVGVSGQAGALLPAPTASIIIDELIRGSPSASTSFGFRAVDFAPPLASRLGDVRAGAGVALVQAGSPTEKAGLRAGDVITRVDDQPVSSASELSRLMDAAGNRAKLTVQRRSDQIEIAVKRAPSANLSR